MSNPRDLPAGAPVGPAVPPAAVAPTPSAPKEESPASAAVAANREKEAQKRRADRDKEWNERLRKVFQDHYATDKRKFFRASFQEEKTLNMEGVDSISSANVCLSKLESGRWYAKPKNKFDLMVEEGRVRVVPSAIGLGRQALTDSAGLMMDYLKQAGATSTYLSIDNFSNYTSDQVYATIKVYFKSALKAELGISYNDAIADAIEKMPLDQRDELLAIKRKADAIAFGREELVFVECTRQLTDEVGVVSRLADQLDVARGDPDNRLQALEKYTEKLESLEDALERAKAHLKSYLDTIDASCVDEKTKDSDIKRLTENVKKSQIWRDQLVSAIDVMSAKVDELKGKLDDELAALSPPSEARGPSASEKSAEESLEAGNVSSIEFEELKPQVEPPAVTLDVNAESSISTDEAPGAGVEADGSPVVDLTSAASAEKEESKPSVPPPATSAEKEESKPLLTEGQESRSQALREKLNSMGIGDDAKKKRQAAWGDLMERNKAEVIGGLLELKDQHQQQKKR